MSKIKKGDTVQVQLGKDSGKTGAVDRVLAKEGLILVAGVNMSKRHVRSYQGMQGGIIDIRKPINLSNVALICPNCKKPTRVGFEMSTGEKKRICKKCQKTF